MEEINKSRLRVLRESANMTQAELGQAVGVTSAAIGQYERGIRSPKDPIKKELARFFHTTVDNIFFET